MTNRIYHYHIKILFQGNGIPRSIGRETSKYSGSLNYEDTFIFGSKSCSMVLSRSKKYEDGSILSNANNTITTQIVKALLCYYAISNDFPNIRSISIVRKQHGHDDYAYTECNSLIQPITSTKIRNLVFQQQDISGLLEETPKGQSLRIAMSYWLKGIASNDEYYKFDHIWRAFNRLFMYQGNSTKEIDCMIDFRNFLIMNSTSFPQSIAITNGYSKDQLHSFRWSKMILNNHDIQSKTKALVDFVKRYHDGRIMALLDEKLSCRRTYLRVEGLDSDVNTYINNHLGDKCDIELVALMTLKYAYFVRNKVFHGETPDGTFKVKQDNIDKEMSSLNELLEILVYEIMKNHSLLRN